MDQWSTMEQRSTIDLGHWIVVDDRNGVDYVIGVEWVTEVEWITMQWMK